jgi:hypothetical protein
MDKLEASIEQLQKKIAAIDAQMLEPDVFTDGAKCKELQIQRAELERDLEPLETEWARRADEG